MIPQSSVDLPSEWSPPSSPTSHGYPYSQESMPGVSGPLRREMWVGSTHLEMWWDKSSTLCGISKRDSSFGKWTDDESQVTCKWCRLFLDNDVKIFRVHYYDCRYAYTGHVTDDPYTVTCRNCIRSRPTEVAPLAAINSKKTLFMYRNDPRFSTHNGINRPEFHPHVTHLRSRGMRVICGSHGDLCVTNYLSEVTCKLCLSSLIQRPYNEGSSRVHMRGGCCSNRQRRQRYTDNPDELTCWFCIRHHSEDVFRNRETTQIACKSNG